MNRENTVVYLAMPPEIDIVDEQLKKNFGVERAININKSLVVKTYSKLKTAEYPIVIGYFFSKKFPDLRWLDSYEPGFLETSGLSYPDAFRKISDYAFKIGAKNVLWINHLCPFITSYDISLAFSNIKEKQIVVGPSTGGFVYLVGFNYDGFKVIDSVDVSPVNENVYSNIVDRIKKSRFSLFELESKIVVKDDESLKSWIENPDYQGELKIDSTSELSKPHHRKKKDEHHPSNQ